MPPSSPGIIGSSGAGYIQMGSLRSGRDSHRGDRQLPRTGLSDRCGRTVSRERSRLGGVLYTADVYHLGGRVERRVAQCCRPSRCGRRVTHDGHGQFFKCIDERRYVGFPAYNQFMTASNLGCAAQITARAASRELSHLVCSMVSFGMASMRRSVYATCGSINGSDGPV